MPMMPLLCWLLVSLVSTCTFYPNTDMVADDNLSFEPAANVQDCCAACEKNPQCKYFTFDNNPQLNFPPCILLRECAMRLNSTTNKTGGQIDGVPVPPTAPKPGVHATYIVSDSGGLGLRWEGIGAISGGGATTKLLRDYDPSVAKDILDFLFLPQFGLSLQVLWIHLLPVQMLMLMRIVLALDS
jgi:hypothetical protein